MLSLFSFENKKVDFLTSYHARSVDGDLCISTGNAKYTKANIAFCELMPHNIIGCEKYAFLNMSDEVYLEKTLEGLAKMDAGLIWEKMQSLTIGDKIPCIVCFEKWDKFCHRHIVARWLEQELGLVFDERINFEGKENLILDTEKFLYKRVQ